MISQNVTQDSLEKKCFSAAYKLINEMILTKSSYPEGAGYPTLLQDPRFQSSFKNLESWVDYLVTKEGGL